MKNKGITQDKIFKLSTEEIIKCRITSQTEIKDLEPIVSIKGSVFCATNEISFISGKPKSGKTSVASIMLSVVLCQKPTFDTLGMQGTYCNDRPIIYIDSEQSRRSSKKILERVKRNLNTEQDPPNLHIFNFRHFGYEELKEAFERLLILYPDAYLWFLDGISDMVKSVNNEEEAKQLIHFLNATAEKNNTAFILFLHENSTSNNDKMRGHLGSEAQRKSFHTISISKDRKRQIHCIKSVECREGRNFEDVLFEFDEQSKSMITLQGERLEEAKKNLDDNKDLWDAASVMTTKDKLNTKTLCDKIMKYKGWGRTKTMESIKEMVNLGILKKIEKSKSEVYYYLHSSELLNMDYSETP
jgi:hypothetical protein